MINTGLCTPTHDYQSLLNQLDGLAVFNDIQPHTLSQLFYLINDLMTYEGADTIKSEALMFKVGRYGKHVLMGNVSHD